MVARLSSSSLRLERQNCAVLQSVAENVEGEMHAGEMSGKWLL